MTNEELLELAKQKREAQEWPYLYCPRCGSSLSMVNKKDYEENKAIELQCGTKNCLFEDGMLLYHHPFDLDIMFPPVKNYQRPPGDSWSLSWIK